MNSLIFFKWYTKSQLNKNFDKESTVAKQMESATSKDEIKLKLEN